ncbi:MAG: hypothetical protein E7K65_11510, partial [Pseudomonas sp.]|nr:hypothetical protein [Pseudomonas sp.]
MTFQLAVAKFAKKRAELKAIIV